MTDQRPEIDNLAAESGREKPSHISETEPPKTRLAKLREGYLTRADAILRNFPHKGKTDLTPDKQELDKSVYDLEAAARAAERELDEASSTTSRAAKEAIGETVHAIEATLEAATDILHPETVEITDKTPYIDEAPIDQIFIDKPIATKTFLRTFQRERSTEPPKPTEMPIYAEIAFTIPQSGRDGEKSPLKCAIIGNPIQADMPSGDRNKQFRLAIYTDDASGIAYVSKELIDLPNGLVNEISDDNFVGEMELIRHNDRFHIKKMNNEGAIQAVVPPQEELRYDPQEQTDLKLFAEEFPEDIDFDINFHRGSYEIKDPEQFYSDLKDEVRGAWVILSKELEIDIHKFPLEIVDFWAQQRLETKGLSGREKASEFIYRKRIRPLLFNQRHVNSIKGIASPAGLLTREKLHIPVEEGEVVHGQTLVHELLHNYMDKEGVDASQYGKGYGKFINEGIGTIGDLLPMKVVTGQMPKYDGIDDMFNEMEDIANGSIKGRVKGSDTTTYNPANTLLHWYLLTERGGIDKIKELASYGSKLNGFNRERFLNAYISTYGESFTELLDKSKHWYKDQLTLAS